MPTTDHLLARLIAAEPRLVDLFARAAAILEGRALPSDITAASPAADMEKPVWPSTPTI